jgi:MFS family permease
MLVAVVLAYLAGASHTMVQIAMTLVGLGWGSLTVAGAALLTEITTVEERPRWQGRSDTLMNAAGATAGALSGVAFAFGDFSLLAVLCGGLLAVGAVASVQRSLRGR